MSIEFKCVSFFPLYLKKKPDVAWKENYFKANFVYTYI